MAQRQPTTTSSTVVQAELFHEDFYEALRGMVAALGGAKAIGSRLFPDLEPDAAARRLFDCLNQDRPQNLSPTQLLTLLKWGREAGHHGAMHYLADEAGYSRPAPIEPEDERAELQRKFIAAVSVFESIAKRIGMK
ncbi:MAG: hypothetical protein KGL39_55890 [Patescibacteria group bacterium]|nr:hypothetical protein [Patescibacteria group bacterium]